MFVSMVPAPMRAMQNNDADEQLHIAAQRGDEQTIIKMLEYGTPINHTNMNGETALMLAAGEGNLPMVQLLLNRGASVNIAAGRNTALTIAEYHGHLPCCELLIERLMKIPNDAQRNNIYLLLLHMRKSGFGRDISFIMKPHLLRIIEEENKERPHNSVALQEINKCHNIGFITSTIKQQLLDKYGPKNAWCSIQ